MSALDSRCTRVRGLSGDPGHLGGCTTLGTVSGKRVIVRNNPHAERYVSIIHRLLAGALRRFGQMKCGPQAKEDC